MRLRELAGRPWVRRLALAVVLPLPLFILLCNVLLWTGAVEALVTRDGAVTRLRLTHGFAWMVWPTRVHVHDPRLEIDAYSYQLLIEADEALLDVRLLSLVERRAHFQEIRAEGVRAQYRIKPDASDANHPELVGFPPFDGTPPQVRSSTPKPLPEPGDEWSLDLDDVDAQVAALWVNAFSFDPVGRIHGGVHWTDTGDFTVDTTTIHPDAAVLWLGEHEAVRDLVGEGTLTIATFDSGETQGNTIPAYMTFDFCGDGTLVDPAGLAIWWPKIDGMVTAEPGPIEIDVAARDGVLTPGSRVHHHSAHAQAGAPSAYVVATADLVLAIEDDGRPSASVILGEARLVGARGELAHTEEIRGRVLVDHGDLARPWQLHSTHVETAEVVAKDLRKLSALAGSDDWQLTRGSARGRGVLDIGADEIPVAELEVAVDDAMMVMGSVQIGGTVDGRGRVRRLRDGEIIADGITGRTKGLSIKTEHGKSDGTWVRVRKSVVRHHEGELRIDGHVTVEDSRPAVVHLTHLDPLIDAIPEVGQIQPIAMHGKVLVRKGLVEIEIVDAKQLGLHVATLWRKRGDDWRLAVWLSGLTAFGFTATEDQKLRRPLVLVGKQWYAEQRRWVRKLGGGDGDPANTRF